MHANLTELVTPFNNAMQAPGVASILDMSKPTGRALAEQMITQQASIIAYANDFKLLMYLTMATIPLVFFIGSSRVSGPQPTNEPAHAMD